MKTATMCSNAEIVVRHVKKADMKFIVIINFATSIGPKGGSWFLYDDAIFNNSYTRQLHVTFCDNAANILYEIQSINTDISIHHINKLYITEAFFLV